jgi:hypothetical protein
VERLRGERFVEVSVVLGPGQQFGGGSGQQLAAEIEFGAAVTVGQQAVVADALKAGR